MHIRNYTPTDKAFLLEILQLNIPQYFAESELHDLENYLEHEIEQYFVAEIENEIVGAGGINFDWANQTGKISWDFINPKFQKMGIGKALLDHRIYILQTTEGIKHITVRTSQLAYQFYEKNGFQLQNIIKDYWAKGFDLYEMQYKND